MSTSPFSYDLRKRVIEFIELGNKKKATAKTFKISVSTVGNWWKRYKETGCFKEKKRPGAKPRLTKKELLDHLKSHPNSTLKTIGKHFDMTDVGALYWMKKFKMSYKKKRRDSWKPTKKSEKII